MRLLLAAMALALAVNAAPAAEVRSKNFLVTAETEELAKKVAVAAEEFRAEKAKLWFGEKLPDWDEPARLSFETGEDMRSSGFTKYFFVRGKIMSIQIEVKGNPKRAFDAVLPHEIVHSIMATHFRRPLPRWADEGIAQYEEHAEVRASLDRNVVQFVRDRRVLVLETLLSLRDYPEDVVAFYAAGYSVTRFLVEKGGDDGRKKFLAFLKSGQNDGWTKAVKDHYGYESITKLQEDWVKTIMAEDEVRREREKKEIEKDPSKREALLRNEQWTDVPPRTAPLRRPRRTPACS